MCVRQPKPSNRMMVVTKTNRKNGKSYSVIYDMEIITVSQLVEMQNDKEYIVNVSYL